MAIDITSPLTIALSKGRIFKDTLPLLKQAGIDDDIARVRAALVADLEEKAYASELAGDVNEALATWEKILTIDPRNIPAQLSRSRLSR